MIAPQGTREGGGGGGGGRGGVSAGRFAGEQSGLVATGSRSIPVFHCWKPQRGRCNNNAARGGEGE